MFNFKKNLMILCMGFLAIMFAIGYSPVAFAKNNGSDLEKSK
jgi:hypothetical protein